jgi:hypothetical protein
MNPSKSSLKNAMANVPTTTVAQPKVILDTKLQWKTIRQRSVETMLRHQSVPLVNMLTPCTLRRVTSLLRASKGSKVGWLGKIEAIRFSWEIRRAFQIIPGQRLT